MLALVSRGLLDDVSLEAVPEVERRVCDRLRTERSEILARIEAGEEPSEGDEDSLARLLDEVLEELPGGVSRDAPAPHP